MICWPISSIGQRLNLKQFQYTNPSSSRTSFSFHFTYLAIEISLGTFGNTKKFFFSLKVRVIEVNVFIVSKHGRVRPETINILQI